MVDRKETLEQAVNKIIPRLPTPQSIIRPRDQIGSREQVDTMPGSFLSFSLPPRSSLPRSLISSSRIASLSPNLSSLTRPSRQSIPSNPTPKETVSSSLDLINVIPSIETEGVELDDIERRNTDIDKE